MLVRTAGVADLERLRYELTTALRRVGLPDPQVAVWPVEALERLAGTGKLKRFVPLGWQPAS